MSVAQQLAKISLEIGAIKINPKNPFTWASGYRMPLYNDNRMLLGKAGHRTLIAEGMQAIIQKENIPVDAVAGVATAGIPHATSLANLIQLPLIYVRSSPKEHGMKNQVEGILQSGQAVVVVEDLISTGGSALKAVDTIREAGGVVEHCFGIFGYGFPEAQERFEKSQCRLHTLLDLDSLLQVAIKEGRISPEEKQVVDIWRKSPFDWGKQQGF
ncbi:MAG: orotate phosphoribosyltransferase [Nitrospinota bacterium]|nr:orotate phosphoribosyltransferase [Nitrospinota bacterium]MDH5789512.1 orotate phosphoribosyltransferase [Nitrospinota bacterium]